MSQPRFITLEGGEGAGKSTQLQRLAECLQNAGLSVVKTRELGGTPEAEAVRTLFLAETGANWLPLSQAMLANTARHEHVERLIKPALLRGEWVICDRFAESTLVYQGLAGVPVDMLLGLQEIALGNFRPDLTIFFDIDPEIGFARLESSSRVKDRFEMMGIDYHRKVRESFSRLASNEPNRFVSIDASQSVETVTEIITREISRRFGMTL